MQKVRVYWNLHKKTWSIQDCKSGLVVDHKDKVVLEIAKFVVRKGGQDRVRKEGKKNVHAFAVGYLATDQDSMREFPLYWRIKYNLIMFFFKNLQYKINKRSNQFHNV